MKIHITNAETESKYVILKAKDWGRCYRGYVYELPMMSGYENIKYAIGCATNDEYGKMWYDEIDKVTANHNGLTFYAQGEPTVDIPIKIVRIIEKEDYND